jgi:CheY-like chemotaxis protein
MDIAGDLEPPTPDPFGARWVSLLPVRDMSSVLSIEKMKPVIDPKILVVDDDEALAECVQEVLREAGYRVDTLTDSGEALGKISATPAEYDILISDNSMPHLTGSQLIEQARRAGFVGKVVMYSGSVSPDEEEEFKTVGADVVLRKPFDLQLLVPTIIDLCGHDVDDGKGPGGPTCR